MSCCSQLVSFINDLRKIPGDVKIVCPDGEFFAISNIISARNPQIGRMLDGSFKEGIEKEICFPDKSIAIVRPFMDYLQFGDNPGIPLKTSIELYLMADEYQVSPLMTYLRTRIQTYADNPSWAMNVYELCSVSVLQQFKESAYKTIIDCMGGKRVKFTCRSCKQTVNVKLTCEYCINLNTIVGMAPQCQNGHDLENLSHSNYQTNYRRSDCAGKLTRTCFKLEISTVSDETLLDVFKRFHSEN